MMEYKGYIARVELDAEARVFHGEVINMRDVVTFEADCVDELLKEFHLSVDDYLDYCKELGEDASKPFSGKFVLRVDTDLHKELFLRSQLENKSLNSWIVEALEEAVSNDTKRVISHQSVG